MHESESLAARTYSVPEAARLLGISERFGYELARRNELPVPVISLGRRMVVSRAALDAVLEEATK
jgi:excisionase family DNA binding protein